MLRNLAAAGAIVVLLISLAERSHAIPVEVVLFSENFNAGLPGSGFTTGGSGTVTGVGGVAQIASGNFAYTTTQTFSGEVFTVEGDVNQLDGPIGGAANGIAIGNRAFVFFGSFAPTPGAFNIIHVNPATGAVTGTTLPDTNMGYVPMQGTNQHFKIEVNPFTNTFDIEVTNGGGPGVFNWTQVDPGFLPGGVGFFNWSSPHTTNFDNLLVTAIQELAVPEPATCILVGMGAMLIVGGTRHRRRC